MPNNTGNPVGSEDPRDLIDNARDIDIWTTSQEPTSKDRLGRTVLTRAGVASAAGDATIAIQAAENALGGADRAEAAAVSVENNATVIAQQAVANVVDAVDGAVAQAEAARDSTVLNALIAEDVTAGLAATTSSGTENRYFRIFAPDESLSFIYYRHDPGPTATEIKRLASEGAVRKLQQNMVETAPGKNLLDKTKIRRGHYFSPGSEAIIASSAYRCTGFIPVQPGQTYVISGNPVAGRVSAFFSAESDTAYIADSVVYGAVATAPAGAAYMVANVSSEGQDVLTYDSTMQIEVGIIATPYESYRTVLSDSYLPAGVARKGEILTDAVSENLFDPASITWTKRLSPSTGGIVGKDANNLISPPHMRVTEGEWYSIGGAALPSSKVVGFFTNLDTLTAAAKATFVAIDGGFKFQVPAGLGINWMRFNVFADVATSTINGTLQLNPGETLKAYTPYLEVQQILPALLPSSGSEFVPRAELLETKSFNLLDPQAVDYSRRYSTGNKAMITDSLGIVASAYIPVTEGEWYTVSGVDGVYALSSGAAGCQGGYFAGDGLTAAVDNITFETPVAGGGAAFLVPLGLGITHVVISLRPLGDTKPATELNGPVQLEPGELSTDYRPYSLEEKIKPEFLPATSAAPGTSAVFNAEQWYRYTAADDGHYLSAAFPVFRQHWIQKDKDLCVVNTGTSLTARSAEHCTDHHKFRSRPPLMHSNNMASILWDRLCWEGQQYRRYDYPGAFVETGAFSTSSNLPEWDDGIYRQGWTRYSTAAGAAVAFVVPVKAWQFNVIYRTDSLGVTDNLVSIAEGDGQMEVQDAAGAWVEANGFVFSMREAAPVARTVLVPRASTGEMVSRQIASKGNTTYQKRLKMRCRSGAVDSRAIEKSVTITAQAAGRFMYWGVEWSPREFMITYVNAARGSHNTQAETANGLPKFQDNEIWSFKPDLLFFELPIHNDGAAAAGSYQSGYWGRLTDHFVFRADYELALKTRGAHFGLAPEIGMFTSSIAWNFGGIEDDGTLKFGEEADTGKPITALDKFTEASLWVWQNHPDALCINAAKRWVDAGVAIFGDLRTATEGSGKDGLSFTNEGSHWNDTGSKIIAKALVPLFDFTHP